MACFIAPAAEAIVVTVLRRQAEKREQSAQAAGKPVAVRSVHVIPWSRKLGWLHHMLWGGVFLLAIEHVWHGEVVPWPPFLTAMNNPADIQPMMWEILTVGGGMVVFVTAVWYVATLVAEHRVRALRARLAVK